MILGPMEGARAKIWRGHQHLADLKSSLEEFKTTTGVRFVRSPEDDQGDAIAWKPTFTNPVPPLTPLQIGDTVHNLRAALDILLCDLARLRGKSTDKIRFPFGVDRETFEGSLKRVSRLGSDVTAALAALKPYRGANDALRGLHELDIADKHELVFPFYVVAVVAVNLPAGAQEAFAEMGMTEPVTWIHEGSRYLHARDRDPRGLLGDIKQGPTALLPDGLPFARNPVVETLETLSEVADEVVESFIRDFGDGDSKPSGTPSVDQEPVSGG